MKLPSDPFILLSMINMKLRDEFDNLDELIATLDIDRDSLTTALSDIGYSYDRDANQFKASL